ncbi:YfaZ family protein [Dasania sp. GY-MA-18]|uniref:YfaZ family protein n=1 Tax=Dasania phycosphaerae TaxID=2950436 RepID=A0A9J6RQF5_9GAMM|nr:MULTISPECIES: YfaZ family protein [Dasania]MCR8924013.1 YfaZ family protein [Dasania sp. GY-MA-18]MCZ0866586.1 YfaZ family protein [Dasania phycosphaerae]MCZ0870171.1 YfaZ family protein [Dasania phycosphaerae]
MTIKNLVKTIALCGLCMSYSAVADSFNLSVSDESFGIGASFDPVGENSSADINLLHDDDFDLLRIGFYVDVLPPESEAKTIHQLDLKLGLKGVVLESDFDDGMALAVGGSAELPVADKVSVYADLYYASGKLSFNDLENYQEWSLGVKAHVIKNGAISLGYGSIEVDTDSVNNAELEDGVVFKIAFGF